MFKGALLFFSYQKVFPWCTRDSIEITVQEFIYVDTFIQIVLYVLCTNHDLNVLNLTNSQLFEVVLLDHKLLMSYLQNLILSNNVTLYTHGFFLQYVLGLCNYFIT